MKQLFKILALCFFSCEIKMDKVYFITLENNSESRLDFHVASESSPVIYPDTILPVNMEDLSLPNITRTVHWSSFTRWEEVINSLPSDTLSIYFFHPDTLSTYDWSEIRNEYKILKRYDCSIEDLQNLNFKISYPPTTEMQTIRQYPPYE